MIKKRVEVDKFYGVQLKLWNNATWFGRMLTHVIVILLLEFIVAYKIGKTFNSSIPTEIHRYIAVCTSIELKLRISQHPKTY